MVNGKQMMIVLQVGDLNILYVDEKLVTWIIKWMKSVYDKDMRVSWGKKHNYLGMYLNLSVLGEVRVTMVD